MRKIRKIGVVAVVTIAVLTQMSEIALSQGLADAAGLGLAPPTSVATVDEASAVLVNPAGIGFTVGPELLYLHSSSYGPWRSDVDSLFAAVTILDTLGVGAGVEVARPIGADTPTQGHAFVRGSLSYALRIDEQLSLGGSYRVLSAQAPGLAAAQMWDAGIIVRPFRFLAAGAVAENLVPPETGRGPLIPRAYRVGFGLRPNHEWATLGIEARFDEQLRVDPAVLLRVEALPGLIASLQLTSRDIARGFGDSTVGFGLEVNHSLVGIGASAAGDLPPGFASFTAYARASLAAYPSVFPRLDRVVKIELADDLRPVAPDNPWAAAAYSTEELPGEIPLALERAARDGSVRGVLLEVRPLRAGFGRIQALRRRIQALRAAGKKVFAVFNTAGDREYLLASAADVIIMPPSGTMNVDGVGLVTEYFADTLGIVGLRAHAVTAGDYKAAPETFTRSSPSPAAIESSTRLSEVMDNHLVNAIAISRQLEPEEVRDLIDRGQLSPEEAQRSGLVDHIAYPDEIEKIIKEELGASPYIDDEYLRPIARQRAWTGVPKVAVVPITETIKMGRSSGSFLGMAGSTGAKDTVDAIERATEDDDVRAIVLRVDSPGGDALASDLIWRAVARAKEKKPVVASFGDVAASGGYYVACGADTIFAEPTTITGSIGVFALFFTGEELLREMGVGIYEQQHSERANALTFDRAPTEAELDMVRRSVEETYELFKRRVAAGRDLDIEQVEEVAQGRVWSGEDARRRRLVDQLGGLAEAIDEARKRAGLNESTDIEVTILRDGGVPMSQWRSAVEGAMVAAMPFANARASWARVAATLGSVAGWLEVAAPGRPVALLPFTTDYR